MSTELNTTKPKLKMVDIYALGEKCVIGRHVICCVPGSTLEGKEVSDWHDIENKPLPISVEFNNGMAKVDEQLAAFLTNPHRNIASKTRPYYA